MSDSSDVPIMHTGSDANEKPQPADAALEISSNSLPKHDISEACGQEINDKRLINIETDIRSDSAIDMYTDEINTKTVNVFDQISEPINIEKMDKRSDEETIAKLITKDFDLPLSNLESYKTKDFDSPKSPNKHYDMDPPETPLFEVPKPISPEFDASFTESPIHDMSADSTFDKIQKMETKPNYQKDESVLSEHLEIGSNKEIKDILMDDLQKSIKKETTEKIEIPFYESVKYDSTVSESKYEIPKKSEEIVMKQPLNSEDKSNILMNIEKPHEIKTNYDDVLKPIQDFETHKIKLEDEMTKSPKCEFTKSPEISKFSSFRPDSPIIDYNKVVDNGASSEESSSNGKDKYCDYGSDLEYEYIRKNDKVFNSQPSSSAIYSSEVKIDDSFSSSCNDNAESQNITSGGSIGCNASRMEVLGGTNLIESPKPSAPFISCLISDSESPKMTSEEENAEVKVSACPMRAWFLTESMHSIGDILP